MDWVCTTSGSVASCTIATSSPSLILFNDFLFVSVVIIFILALLLWGLVFSIFKV